MSRTLNLVDILLTTGRNLFLMGRYHEALVPLTKLCGFRKLPKPALEELQALLGEIYLQKQDFKAARRHLTAALAVRPLNAQYHFLMAVAIEEDREADRERAEMFYARAVELEPEQPAYWVDFGSYLFTIGKTKEALKAIRKAYALGSSDAEIVGEVAEVLRREDCAEEAMTKLRAAFFHNHGKAGFRELMQKHQFAMIYAEQNKKRTPQDLAAEPVILEFVPRATEGKYIELGEKTIRIDRPETLAGPKDKTPAPYKRPPRKG